MANELRAVSSTGVLYARIINNAGLWWNGTTFEAYNVTNYALYCITLTEQGDSSIYVGNFPTGITVGGTYVYYVYRRVGGSPAQTDTVLSDTTIDWTGTTVITSSAGAMTGSDFRDYILRQGFKRTDKDTELYEAVTDAIQELRRRFSFDEAEVEATTADTISVLGDFKLAVESDLGLLQGVIIEDNNQGIKLKQLTKAQFDTMYPFINTDTTFSGFPTHYCVYAAQIYLGPRPDKISYAYRLTYSRRAGTIVSTTAGVPFTNLYRMMLADLAMSYLYGGLEEVDKATYYMQKFENALLKAISRERINSGQGTFNQVPTNL